MTRPFSCGTQCLDWEESNCMRCTRHGNKYGSCDITDALCDAFWGDGHVPDDILERMNYTPDAYVWICGEVEWTEEWKKEWTELHEQLSTKRRENSYG